MHCQSKNSEAYKQPHEMTLQIDGAVAQLSADSGACAVKHHHACSRDQHDNEQKLFIVIS